MPFGNGRFIQHFSVQGSLLLEGIRDLGAKEDDWKHVWNLDTLLAPDSLPFFWSTVNESHLFGLILAATKLSTVPDDDSGFEAVHDSIQNMDYMKGMMDDFQFNTQFKRNLNSHGLCDWGTLYREVNTPHAIAANNGERGEENE